MPLAVALAFCACSTLPEARYPQFADYRLRADFRVGDDGLLPFPQSTTSLVVRALALQPTPLAEQFDRDGGRRFRFAPGQHVAVDCELRAYGAPPPTAHELLPCARRIDELPAAPPATDGGDGGARRYIPPR